MDGQQQHTPPEVNGFFRGLVIATAATVAAACVVIGGCVAVKADAVNAAGSPRIQTAGATLYMPNQSGPVKAGEHIRSRCDDLWMHEQDMAHPRRVEDRCRAKGWHIGWRYNLSPNGQRIWTGYPACEQEDGVNCYWDAHVQGNHRGHSSVTFVRDHQVWTVYVRRINGHRA